jgi:DNA-binding transcriptional LysR family regulator
MLLPMLMQRLGKLAPNLKLSFVDIVHPGNLHEISRLDVDIALPCTHDIPPNIIADPMFWSAWQVVSRLDHPRLTSSGIGEGDDIPIDLFCDMNHVVFSSEGQHASYEDHVLATLGRSRNVALAVGSFRDLYETVAGSDLLAVLPGTLARSAAQRFGLSAYPVPFSMEPALLWLAWNRWQTDNPAHRWLRGEIADLLRGLNDVDRPLPAAHGTRYNATQAAE